jgi:multiple sugar transport system permease protein
MLKQRARFAYFLILPSLILITLLNLVPIIEGVIVSFQNHNLIRPNPDAFVGFKHYYRALFEEDEFWGSLGKTVIWTVGSVVGGYVLGLSLALLLNLNIKARGFFRALFLLPWVIPDVCTALLWKWLYQDEFGIINFMLAKFGLIQQPILWLADTHLAMPAVIFVQIWKLYPVMFIVLLAALQNVPGELLEAAKIDGASAVQRFWHVILPLIRPTSVIITLLASIWTFQSFDLVYLLTGGGPADSTQILPTLMYEKAFWGSQLGYAAAIGMLMLLCLLVISIFYLLIYRNQPTAKA